MTPLPSAPRDRGLPPLHVSLSQTLLGIEGRALPLPPPPPPRATLTAGLHADQLQLYALDGGLRALDHQLPGQRLRDDTVGGVEVPSDEKFGEQGSLERDKGWWERKVPRELTPEAVTGYKEKLKTKLGNFYKTRWAPVVQNGKKVQ